MVRRVRRGARRLCDGRCGVHLEGQMRLHKGSIAATHAGKSRSYIGSFEGEFHWQGQVTMKLQWEI